jgi:phage gpG-like protein
MSGLVVKFNDKNFKSFMKDLKQTTKNLEPAFRDFGNYLKKETDTQFQKEIDPNGKPWEPLKPSTIARKRTPYKLRETFFMYNSIYFKSSGTTFEFGIKDPKYQFHHFGTSKMPARVIVGVPQDRRKKLNGFIIAQIRRVKGLRQQRRKK